MVPFDLKLALLPGCLEEERYPQEAAAGFQPTLRLWRQMSASLETSLARPDFAQDCRITLGLSRRSCNRSSNSRPQMRLEGRGWPLAAMWHRSSTVCPVDPILSSLMVCQKIDLGTCEDLYGPGCIGGNKVALQHLMLRSSRRSFGLGSSALGRPERILGKTIRNGGGSADQVVSHGKAALEGKIRFPTKSALRHVPRTSHPLPMGQSLE